VIQYVHVCMTCSDITYWI